MPPPTALMIFAAGLGTRMGALTADRPKPLIEVAGRPLIDHTLAHGHAAGANPIVANTHYRAEQMEAYLDARGIAVSREHPDILDTGGGLRAALPLLGPGPVFTLNADATFDGPNPLVHLVAHWRPDEMDALLLLCPPDRALGHDLTSGFAMDAAGRLTRATTLAYTGAQIIRTDRLKEIPGRAFSLNRLWDKMAETGRLFGAVYPGRWCDVGHPGGIALAEAMLRGKDV